MNNSPSDLADSDFGDQLLSAMAAGGVEAIFYVNGSDIMFYQESASKRMERGEEQPRLYTMTHELVALNAALGYTAVSGKPSVTAAHVDLGTLNYGSAIHAAARARLPVLITAGLPPTAMPATIPGARDAAHYWAQQTRDQVGIVRQYVKWDHTLAYQDSPGAVVSRALQVACSVPEGASYLALPREVQVLPLRGESYPATAELGMPAVGEPSVETCNRVIRHLREADDPVIVVGLGGRHPESARVLAAFADRFGVRVVPGSSYAYQAISMDHPMFDPEGPLESCDFALVLECPVPWLPGKEAPPASVPTVVVDSDPTTVGYPLMEFPATLRIVSDTETFLDKILAVASSAETDDGHWDERRLTTGAAVRARREAATAQAASRRHDSFIDPVWAAQVIAEEIPSDARVLDGTIWSAPVARYLRLEGPGQYFKRPSSAGGWGVGAALGAALAEPTRLTVLVVGDGFYSFGVPNSALWAARKYNAPFLTVIYQNDSYNTGTEETAKHYPGGFAARHGYPGGYLTPGIDFAAESAGAGAYGENVTEPGELRAALRRGIEAVRSGRAAVLAITVPRLLEEPEVEVP